MHRKLCTVELKSSSLLSCLSVSTICLLIFTSIVIITVISITPIIILGLGEINAGQRDLILRPIDPSSTYINSTKITERSGHISMPRQSAIINVNKNNAMGVFMDFGLESTMHLGSLPITPQPDANTHYIYLHSQFGYSQGQFVHVQIQSYAKIFTAIKSSVITHKPSHYSLIIKQIDEILELGIDLSAEFEVAFVYDTAYGKFPVGSVGGTAYLNISNAFHHIVNTAYRQQNRKSQRNQIFLNYLNQDVNYADFSSEVTINLPNRIDVYLNSNYQQTYYTLSEFTEEILSSIGMFSVDSEVPIGAHLIEMSYFGMFIGVVLKLIIISLFILSILMMNNMLNVGIDRKNFDFALLKTMGADRFFIIGSLLVSSLKYVVIANCLAFPFAYFSLDFISQFFVEFFGYRYDVEMSWEAVLGSLFIGVLVPIVSSIAPIWGVINNDLAENLNPLRNKTQSIKTEIYIQGAQFPADKLVFGALSLTFGLMIYYLLPKGLINQDIGLLLFVFFTILVGLLLGLIILSYSFQYLFEKLIAYITLFWINKTDLMLTMKNLSAHRFRNRRSSLLYALSVSFVIFVSVGLSIQMQTISEQLLKLHGTYIQISSPLQQLNKEYFDDILATKFKDGIVDWAYQTSQIDYQLAINQNVDHVLYSDKARLYLMRMKMYGVSPNYLKVMPPRKFHIAESYAYEPYDPYEFLYTPDGYMTCTISQYAAQKLNTLGSNNRQFLINYYQPAAIERRTLNISTVFSNTAGLGYSKFKFGRQHLGVSFDTYLALSGLNSYTEIPYSKLKLQVRDPSDTQSLANKLRKEISSHSLATIWDYSQVKTTIDRIQNLLDNIMIFLLVLVLLISFFSLVTTSYINIVNQSTEIGILLTLGYQRSRVLRIYIYEAFVLVVNSCLIGIAVGVFVAWMMSLQRELFGDFPVEIRINGIWIIGVVAVISSILSTLKPIRDLFKRSINQIFMYS